MSKNIIEKLKESLDAQGEQPPGILGEILAQSLAYLGLYCLTYGYVHFFPTQEALVIVMQYVNTVGAVIIGAVFATSQYKVRYFYPLLAGVIFLPAALLLYNKTALAFGLNYALAAYLGFLIAAGFSAIRRVIRKANKNMGKTPKKKK